MASTSPPTNAPPPSSEAHAPSFPRITDRSFTSSQPLPDNYTRQLDQSGRPYYINQTDNSTSWYHPSASQPLQDPALPKHIERMVDVRGRSYYVNHETKETSWLNPLKLEVVKGRAEDEGGSTECESTEDGEELYWVDYEKGTVTVPRNVGKG